MPEIATHIVHASRSGHLWRDVLKSRHQLHGNWHSVDNVNSAITLLPLHWHCLHGLLYCYAITALTLDWHCLHGLLNCYAITSLTLHWHCLHKLLYCYVITSQTLHWHCHGLHGLLYYYTVTSLALHWQCLHGLLYEPVHGRRWTASIRRIARIARNASHVARVNEF
jgi:hypothetical protein